MEAHEILRVCFGKSKDNMDFLTYFAKSLENKFPTEASAIHNWKAMLQDCDGANARPFGCAPFAWVGPHRISEDKRGRDFFGLVLAAQQQFFTAENYRMLAAYIDRDQEVARETSIPGHVARVGSPVLSEFTILVFKYSQSTGAHLNIKRLETMFENLSILDVKDLSAESVFDGCAGRPYVLINTIQPVTLWPEFENFIKKANEKNITIVYYFHEGDDIIGRFAADDSKALSAFRASLQRAHFLSLTTDQELILQKRFPEISRERFHFQGNVLAHDDYNFPPRMPSEAQRFMVVIGSIQPRKGIDFVKHLASAIEKIDPDMHVLWLGLPNRYEPSYWRDIPKNLHFMGEMSGAARKVVCARAHALLMPSEEEPFSFSVAEAVIAGLPIVFRVDRCGLLEQIEATKDHAGACFGLEEITDESVASLLRFLDRSRSSTKNVLSVRVEDIMEPNRYAHRIRRNLMRVLSTHSNAEVVGKLPPKSLASRYFSACGYDTEKCTSKWLKVFERNR